MFWIDRKDNDATFVGAIILGIKGPKEVFHTGMKSLDINRGIRAF